MTGRWTDVPPVLAVTDDADDAVAVDADVIFGVGVHGDGLIVAVT